MQSLSVEILYTGGTIGMTAGVSGLVPDIGFEARLKEWIEDFSLGFSIKIRTLMPLIDSADAIPEHWLKLSQEIMRTQATSDGVVILHGTDTMAYTASALSFLLASLPKPIVLTGAQIPFGMSGSDAKANLAGAIRWAADSRINEVCIYFDGKLLRGNRAIKFGTRIGESFRSPHWPILAGPEGELNAGALLDRSRRDPAPTLPATLAAHPVALIKVYPGMSASIIRAAAENPTRGLVLELFGSGTAPVLNAEIQHLLRDLAARERPVIGVSQCPHGVVSPRAYASNQALSEAGVIPGHDLTPEAALTKLNYLLALGTPFSALGRRLRKDYAGEVCPENT